MDFLRRNSGKIALLAIIAFFTLPFIYGNEEEEDFSPFAVRSGMSYQSNPISKLANKIASFYGFSRPGYNEEMVASSNGVDSIKEKVADNPVFGKKDARALGQQMHKNPKNEEFLASARKYKNFDRNFDEANNPTPGTFNGMNSFPGGASSNSYTKASNSPVKGYVTINGQNYDVIEDIKGEKYVVTPKGHIPLREIARRNISEKEFLAAKKRLVGASDMEVLNALQEEKERQAYAADASRRNYQGNTNYRNGAAANMGGNNYARVSTNDTGFDDDLLSNAYENLKNMNFNVEGSSSSSGNGGSYGGGYGGGSRGGYVSGSNGSSDTQNPVNGEGVTDGQFSAGAIYSEIGKNTKENIKLKKTNTNNQTKQTSTEQLAQVIEKTEEVLAAKNPVDRNRLNDYWLSKKKGFVTLDEEGGIAETKSGNLYILTEDQQSNYAAEYDKLPGNNRVLPVKVNSGGGIEVSDSNTIKNLLKKLNPDLAKEENELDKQSEELTNKIQKEIKSIQSNFIDATKELAKTEKVVYIDCSNSDDITKQYIETLKRLDNVKLIDNSNIEPDGENIVRLEGPATLTEGAFEEFLNEVKKNLGEEQPA